MCFCLLPVTGFKFEFVFLRERESTGLAIVDIFTRLCEIQLRIE